MKTKKATLAILGFAAATDFAVPVAAQDSGFYAGLSLGQSSMTDACTGLPAGVSCDDKDSAWKIFGGYQFSRNFALELGYANLGEAKASGGGVSAAPDATVWVALRPEKIVLSRERPEGDGDNRIEGLVAEVAYRGDQSIYLVTLASGRQMRVTQPNLMRTGTGDRIRWDDRVWLSWDSSSLVVVTQ